MVQKEGHEIERHACTKATCAWPTGHSKRCKQDRCILVQEREVQEREA